MENEKLVRHSDQIDLQIRGLYQKQGVTVIGKPVDFVYPSKYFMDTPYHMVKSGVRLRTGKLTKLLKPYLSRYRLSGSVRDKEH